MNIIYLKIAENWKECVSGKICKWNLWIKKIEYKCRKIFNIPLSYRIYSDKIKYILPYTKKETKRINKFFKKIKNVKGIVLDKELNNNEEILKHIKDLNLYVFDGKWLFKYLIIDTIEYICEKSNIEMANISIALLIKEVSDESIQTIYEIVNKVKSVSIVTSELDKFTRIENKLYEEYGIPIKVTNNKNKSLKKEKFIVNIDFGEKELNMYNICKNAIVINVNQNIEKLSKTFQGININNFEIKKTLNSIEGFAENSVYESSIYKKDTYNNVKQILKKDKIEIEYLIGKRGRIIENEFKDFYKNY